MTAMELTATQSWANQRSCQRWIQLRNCWSAKVVMDCQKICQTNKHRKNCKCCPVSLSIVRSQWLSWIQVLNCLNCQQFHTSSQATPYLCHVFVMVSKVTSDCDRSLKVSFKWTCLCYYLLLCIWSPHSPHIVANAWSRSPMNCSAPPLSV